MSVCVKKVFSDRCTNVLMCIPLFFFFFFFWGGGGGVHVCLIFFSGGVHVCVSNISGLSIFK